MFWIMLLRITSVVLSFAGLLALVLGVLHWLGVAMNLITMHMLLGLLAVGALWVIGIAQALSPGGSWIIAALSLLLGVVTIFLGWNQATLLVGELHWLVQLMHALAGVFTIGIGHMGAARVRKSSAKFH
jgi:hypothetical protein